MAPDTTLIEYPRVYEYVEALQHPRRCFRDADLQAATPDTDGRGDPLPRTGGHAAVFKLMRGAAATAVKVFKNPHAGRQARYQALSDHLARQPTRCLVGFRYDPQGVRVAGRWYPLLAMDWVEGMPLMRWVGAAVHRRDSAALTRLAERWAEMLRQLQSRQIAHGDLQHGNVLIVGDEPVLVDYDGMCVPALAGQESWEGGLPGYQHPGREGQPLALRQDDFAAWVIWLALRGLAADLSLWSRHVERFDNENLLFTDADITWPRQSALWEALLRSPDAEVAHHAALVRTACAEPYDRVPRFAVGTPPLLDPAGETLEVNAAALETAEVLAPTETVSTPSRAAEPAVRGEVDLAVRRAACLAALACVPREPTETADRAYLAAWREEVLAGSAEGEALRPRLLIVRARLRIVDDLLAALQAGDDPTAVALAGRLPRTYMPDAARARQVEAARDRLRLHERLLAALASAPTSDLAVAAAWEAYSWAGGTLADPHRHERCLLALRRREALATLRQQAPGVPRDLADANVLLCWREGDLADCADVAAAEREHFDEARRRSTLWHELEEALRRSDHRTVERLSASPLLLAYPPRLRRQAEIDALLREGSALGQLLDAFDGHKTVDALLPLDLSAVARHPTLFVPHVEQVRQLLARQVGAVRLRPLTGPEVLVSRAGDWSVVVRWTGWTWRTLGLGERTCRVAVDPQRFFDRPDGVATLPVKERVFGALGGLALTAPAYAQQLCVTVWPVLRLAALNVEAVGAPLHLGPVLAPPRPARPGLLRRWLRHVHG